MIAVPRLRPVPAADIIAETARLVRQAYPFGKALIVTGSAARNEATVAVTPGQTHWLSDLEFLVVVSDWADLPAEARTLDWLASEIGRQLAARHVRVAIELTPAPKRYFASIRPHLFGYELMTCGRQVYGATDYLDLIPRFRWSDIPGEDAWRLVSNRMMEWLDFRLRGGRLPLPAQFYVLAKQYLDLATALALLSGHYAPSYRERTADLDAVAAWMERSGIEIPAEAFVQAVRVCFQFKLDPLAGFDWLWRSDTTDLRSAMERAGYGDLYHDLARTASAVWRWEGARLAGVGSCENALALSSVRRIYGIKGHVRGWAKLLWCRRGGLDRSSLARWLRLFPQATPRALVYACAARLLHADDPQTLMWVRRHLPLLSAGCDHSWSDLALECVATWKLCLRRSGA
jgi:hypothetical protein